MEVGNEGVTSLPEDADDSRPVAIARFDPRAGALSREAVFRSLFEATKHFRAVAERASLIFEEPVQVDSDGLGVALLFDSEGQTVLEFHLVNQVSSEFSRTDGVAVFGVNTAESGKVTSVMACGVYGSHTEVLEAEEFARSFIKGSEGLRYAGLTIPFSLGEESRFESVEKAG